MRQKLRVQPYLSRDVHRQLREYAAAIGQTESAVVEQAIVELMRRGDVDRDLIVRRLDGVTQPLAKVQHDVDLLSEAFAAFVRFFFILAPAEVPGGAKERGDARYEQFLGYVAKEFGAGVRLAGEIVRVSGQRRLPPPGPDPRQKP
jgi:hypothetical protein